MKELSLNILDIAQNSVKAGAKDIDIRLTETADTLTIEISSVSERDDPRRHGTRVTANFNKNNIDFTPLGDIVSTVTALIQGAPGIEWRFIHETPAGKVELDTRELRQVLGDVPLDNFEVIKWVEDYLKEGYASLI